jgi:hydroxymethylpyrimidine pyrophosphatase-like HAD family hydrolase
MVDRLVRSFHKYQLDMDKLERLLRLCWQHKDNSYHKYHIQHIYSDILNNIQQQDPSSEMDKNRRLSC